MHTFMHIHGVSQILTVYVQLKATLLLFVLYCTLFISNPTGPEDRVAGWRTEQLLVFAVNTCQQNNPHLKSLPRTTYLPSVV